jgi:ATP-dependent protease ClpP protease subunit
VKVNKKTVLTILTLAVLALVPAIKASSSPNSVKVLKKDNVVALNEPVTAESVAAWTLKIRELDAKGGSDCIVLVMNSPGGDIVAGKDFIEAVRGTKRPICTVTIFAASMAFQIVQNMGERLVLKTGILMSHRAKGGFEGEFGGPSPSQVDARYGLWLDIVNGLDQVAVDRTKGKQTMTSYQKAYGSEMWRVGQRGVDEGYADRVVTASCDSSLSGVTSHNADSPFGFSISYDLSECPLITGPLNVKVNIPTNKGLMRESDFVAQGGRFDAYCMSDTKDNKLCSLDTSLNPRKLTEIKSSFRSEYFNKQSQVIYMHF